jgi:hypothetical protein
MGGFFHVPKKLIQFVVSGEKLFFRLGGSPLMRCCQGILKNLVFCSDNNVPTLFRNLQRAWSVILSKKRYTLYSPQSGFQCYKYTLTTPHQGASTKPEKKFFTGNNELD